MSTQSIQPIPPNYGAGGINPNNQNRRQGKSFESALEKGPSQGSAEAADHEDEAPSRPLQLEAPVFRRETQADGHHIDVIA